MAATTAFENVSSIVGEAAELVNGVFGEGIERMEPLSGIEPETSSLPRKCSTN
jgi:hypothetical protein